MTDGKLGLIVPCLWLNLKKKKQQPDWLDTKWQSQCQRETPTLHRDCDLDLTINLVNPYLWFSFTTSNNTAAGIPNNDVLLGNIDGPDWIYVILSSFTVLFVVYRERSLFPTILINHPNGNNHLWNPMIKFQILNGVCHVTPIFISPTTFKKCCCWHYHLVI